MLNLLDYDPFQNDVGSFERFGEEARFSSCLDCPPKGKLVEEDSERLNSLAAFMRQFKVTFFLTQYAKEKDVKSLTLHELRELIEKTSKRKKEALPWLKLATFGDKRSPKGSYRYNDNMLTITGVEGEHDAGALTFEEAVRIAGGTGLLALLYTSPSHTSKKPRWRILCPTSKPLPSGERAKLLARINGIYDGAITPESFAASQAFYFGSVNHNPDHEAVIVEGDFIDEREDLDEGAIGKRKGKDNGPLSSDRPTVFENFGKKEYKPPSLETVEAALKVIPPTDAKLGRKYFVIIGHAVHAATEGSADGLKLFDDWRQRGPYYDAEKVAEKWEGFRPTDVTFGTLAHYADQTDPSWRERIGDVEVDEPAGESEEQAPERTWPVLPPEAMHGLAGEVVRTIEPHTESDPAAILLQFLVYFGNVIGRGPFVQREGDKHFTNLFAVLVGESAKSRKGTSAGRVREIMNGVDEEWTERCIASGLSSGEGLIWAIRDDEHGFDKKGQPTVLKGVQDKRLLLDEREFAQVLMVIPRDGNTVSRVIRVAWDGHPLNSLTKQNKGSVKKPHISMVGHITRDELRQYIGLMSMTNGFANRILFGCVRRSKELPHGGYLTASTRDALCKKISNIVTPLATSAVSEGRIGVKMEEEESSAVHFKTFGKQQNNGMVEVDMNAEARRLWESMYHDLTNGPAGALGAICGRADAQTIRLALLYALLDSKDEIEPVHLRAALAVWKYCEDSARYIFGESVGSAFADELLRVLRESGGMSRTKISDTFQRNQKHENIAAALNLLRDRSLIKREERAPAREKSTGGRAGKIDRRKEGRVLGTEGVSKLRQTS